MAASSPPATRPAPGTDGLAAVPRPRGFAPGARLPGTIAQLAGHGAWLVAIPKRRVFPGRPEQVAHARRFVARVLEGCPAVGDALLCCSELAGNAIRHTRTGRGGKFQVVVWRGHASACVAVLDDGSDTVPVSAPPRGGELPESGNGLLAVHALAACWGHHVYRDGVTRGTAVWFRLDWAAR